MAVWTQVLMAGVCRGMMLSGFVDRYVVETKATAADTSSDYSLQEMTMAAGFPWIPPHRTRHEDEALYTLEGSQRSGSATASMRSGRGRTSSCRAASSSHSPSRPSRPLRP